MYQVTDSSRPRPQARLHDQDGNETVATDKLDWARAYADIFVSVGLSLDFQFS
jgi:hypothetical protein